MVRVEVIFESGVEVWDVPSNPDLDWSEDNAQAMRVVYEDLKRRAVEDNLSLKGLEMWAVNSRAKE
jgi:hypothetical protein